MKIGCYRIEPDNDMEAYKIIDAISCQSHDGDGAKEIIAHVYEEDNAILIANLLWDNKPS